MHTKGRKAALYVTLVLAVIAILMVPILVAPEEEAGGAGGIDYDPETYPNDERGIPPDQRGGGGIDYDPDTYPNDERGIPPDQRGG